MASAYLLKKSLVFVLLMSLDMMLIECLFSVEKVQKTQNRTELKKLVTYVAEYSSTIDAAIVLKLDRLTRNLMDQHALFSTFANMGVRILSATENNEESAFGKFVRNIVVSQAQYDNDKRSEQTTHGMQEAIKQGRWIWKAPFGYKMGRDDFGKPILVPVEEEAFLISVAFELAEKGIYKQSEILRRSIQ